MCLLCDLLLLDDIPGIENHTGKSWKSGLFRLVCRD